MNHKIKLFLSLFILVGSFSCTKDFLTVDLTGADLEENFYQTEEDFFQGLVAVYDAIAWGSTSGDWTMQLGLLNAASDDTHAGGSDSGDQPSWVAWDNFTLDAAVGPQRGLWAKNYTGIYRANLLLEKMEFTDQLSPAFQARVTAECKFLRAWFYFDLVRLFGNVPILTKPVTPSDLDNLTQVSPAEVYAFIEQDLRDAKETVELPETVPPDELGRITQGAVTAFWGKVILFQNDESRMQQAADLFEEVITSGNYFLMSNFEDIFKMENEWGPESVFEIQYSDNRPGDWGCCFAAGPNANPTEGNFNVQFFGMRDYSGPVYAPGWSFCPVSTDLVDFMQGDPRMQHTIIDGNALKAQGATYTVGFQNTDYFIRKYAPLKANEPQDGVIALEWQNNIREIRYADVLLMAAETNARAGNDSKGRTYLNQVRARVGLQPFTGGGQVMLDFILDERRRELATEGHRYWDLLRTGKATEVLGPLGYTEGKNNLLPIPQSEIDLTQGQLIQNPGY